MSNREVELSTTRRPLTEVPVTMSGSLALLGGLITGSSLEAEVFEENDAKKGWDETVGRLPVARKCKVAMGCPR